jgi:hypothetical protein
MHGMTKTIICGLALAALSGLGLQACSNSILRNAAEAGVETVLEGPLPTPTPATSLTR